MFAKLFINENYVFCSAKNMITRLSNFCKQLIELVSLICSHQAQFFNPHLHSLAGDAEVGLFVVTPVNSLW